MKNVKKMLNLALLGTGLLALGAMTSCCGSDTDLVQVSPVPVVEPTK